MAPRTEIDVWQGEIAELEVDALVVGANESLFMTVGPAASVRRHGGDAIENAAIAQGPLLPGNAIVTTGGSLRASYVIHAVCAGHERIADRAVLGAAIRAALDFAEPLALRRIAFSLLGVDHGVFTASEAADALADALTVNADRRSLPEAIVIATVNATETHAVNDALSRHRARAT